MNGESQPTDPADRALLLLQRADELLFECRAVSQQLQATPSDESPAAAAERDAPGVLVAALEEGLVNTLEHAIGFLERFKTTDGVLGEAWLREQEKKFGRLDGA
jgi:hypothetical protein